MIDPLKKAKSKIDEAIVILEKFEIQNKEKAGEKYPTEIESINSYLNGAKSRIDLVMFRKKRKEVRK